MRLLVATGLYPPDIGGPATYARSIEDGLPERGIEVVVVPFALVRRYPRGLRHLIFFFMLLRALRRADAVLALDPFSVGIPAVLAATVLRKKFLLKIVGDYAWEQSTQRFGYQGTIETFQQASLPFVPSAFRTLERLVARSAAAVIVPSRYLGNIIAAWGIRADRITVIYNGVSVGDVGDPKTIRGVLHFSGKLVISVGRLVPWKGFEVLIRVCRRLKKKHPDLTLFIVGSGPDLERLERIVAEERLSSSVIFAGAVDRDALLRYLRAADLFVLNTSYEGFSHLILEALAVGTPVITTTVGGNPEIIIDGENGSLVAPNDLSALESRIGALLLKPELARQYAATGLERMHSFTDAVMLDRTAAVLHTL